MAQTGEMDMERVTEDGSAPDVIADHPHGNEGDGEERGPVDGTNSDGEGNEGVVLEEEEEEGSEVSGMQVLKKELR